jgi:DNA polymerase III delta prime subunit
LAHRPRPSLLLLPFLSSLSQIIPALQSRCTRFRFGPLETEQVRNRLQFVIKQEK